jgi:uncharacterized membrane protein
MEQDNNKHANNIFSIEFWRQREMDLYVGKLLRYGVFTACFITVLGGIIYVMQSHGMPDYRPAPGHHDQFKGVIPYLRELNTIIPALLRLDGAAIIQFGVVVLIATPILRVAFSAVVFLIERDYLYVVVTLIVLAIIILNMIFGLH